MIQVARKEWIDFAGVIPAKETLVLYGSLPFIFRPNRLVIYSPNRDVLIESMRFHEVYEQLVNPIVGKALHAVSIVLPTLPPNQSITLRIRGSEFRPVGFMASLHGFASTGKDTR